MKRKRYCIICGEEKNGLPVKNDHVLEMIRWVKRNITRNEQGNELVVCRECYPKYSKLRSKSISRMGQFLVLGIVFAILFILVSPGVLSVVVGIIVVLLLYSFSLLTYMPALATEKEAKPAK